MRKLSTKLFSPSVVNEPPPPSINEPHLLNEVYELQNKIKNLERDVIAKDNEIERMKKERSVLRVKNSKIKKN